MFSRIDVENKAAELIWRISSLLIQFCLIDREKEIGGGGGVVVVVGVATSSNERTVGRPSDIRQTRRAYQIITPERNLARGCQYLPSTFSP